MKRIDGRELNQLRPVKITRDFLKYAEGSVLIEMGNTKVIVAVSIEEGNLPPFVKAKNATAEVKGGWITAEYSMLPRAGKDRSARASTKGKPDGRSLEIQRLIGRVLRTICDPAKIGERTIYIDCDVIQADGGTRTASITGAYVALKSALDGLVKQGKLKANPLATQLAAVSVGVVDGEMMLDLCYEEDSRAEVDMNVIMTSKKEIIEVQGTAEKDPFSIDTMNRFIEMGYEGVRALMAAQDEALKS